MKTLYQRVIPALLVSASMTFAAFANEIAATASSGNGDYRPEHAVDSDSGTRWSSDFNDDQWLLLDLGAEKTICGVRLHWETAYGRDYDIQVSSDGKDFQTVAETRDGDGGVDVVYFGPRKTRYVRMDGIRRGTGWGYSLWEVDVLGDEAARKLTASSAQADHAFELAMDGSRETAWQSDSSDKKPWLLIEFPQRTAFGGVQIVWAGDAVGWKAETQASDGAWHELMRSPGAGPVEDAFFDRTEAEGLRLQFEGTAAVAEVTLKGPDETWNPERHFEMLSQRLPKGAMPRWLYREQAFWTIVGLPRSPEESLLDEDGRLETHQGGFSITPVLLLDGQMKTANDFAVTQELLEGWAPIPSVEWNGNDLKIRIDAVAAEPGATIARTTLTNEGTMPRNLSWLLAARPIQLNPPWQHGGFSEIREARFVADGAGLIVHGKEALRVIPAPSATALVSAGESDVLSTLVSGGNDSDVVTATPGVISAGMRFDMQLAPGESKSILLEIPLSGRIDDLAAFDFDNSRDEVLEQWRSWTGDWAIDVPNKRLAQLVRSNLAYLLLNADGPSIQPGSRNYNHAWIRDGAMSATAMLRFDVREPIRDYAKWFAGLVHDDGFVPFIVDPKTNEMPGWANDWAEYDSFGELAYLARQADEFLDDETLNNLLWPKVKAAMSYQENLRKQRLTAEFKDTEFYGILPPSNSHEGYFPGKHSYWDDFWALRGLHDAQAFARRHGEDELADHYAEEEAAMRTDLLQSIELVRHRDNLETLPACAELGDFDPTSTSIAMMVGNEQDNLPADALKATYDRYLDGIEERRTTSPSSYTPYEVRTVSALIRLGRPAEARGLLNYLIEDGVRPKAWNHLAEVVHPDPRTPSYIGDMPHTWVGSGLINAVRDLFVYENGEKLIVAAGVPDEWYDAGASVSNLPTWWGELSYRMKRNESGTRMIILETEVHPPGGVVAPTDVQIVHAKVAEEGIN
ncbi:discoidin domain-containing protein [bacterium]|nr:discoidin domain-containing protein [bacterium]